jgi:hypothetical protein
MISWQYFPKSNIIPNHLSEVISVFKDNEININSDNFEYSSNAVLEFVTKGLEQLNYKVEIGKKANDKVQVPVLFGINGKLEKYFDADAYNVDQKSIIEVEAGRAYTNYQFLKDLFQACMMFEVDFLTIAVRRTYLGNPDFQKIITFFETLYASSRLKLPLKGILIIGY